MFILHVKIFSEGFFDIQYVVKILMGGVDSWFDDLDERKVTTDDYGRPRTDSTHKRKKHRCVLQ